MKVKGIRYLRTVESAIINKTSYGYTIENILEPLELKLSSGLGSYTIAFKHVNA